MSSSCRFIGIVSMLRRLLVVCWLLVVPHRLTTIRLLTNKTRNTLDCDQSNVLSSHVVFLAISQDLPFRSFSLYHRSASDAPLWFEISVKSPSLYYRLETEAKVWSGCIHTVNRIMRCWDMAIWIFPKMCEWALRSVGRSSVVNIHTSYTDLIYCSFGTLGT